MIVKVQSSLSSSDGVRSCLIYNKTKTIFYETREESEVEALLVALKGRPKAYFSAKVNPKKESEGEKVVSILAEASTQVW